MATAKLDTKMVQANYYPSFAINAGVGLEAFSTKFLTSTPESLESRMELVDTRKDQLLARVTLYKYLGGVWK